MNAFRIIISITLFVGQYYVIYKLPLEDESKKRGYIQRKYAFKIKTMRF